MNASIRVLMVVANLRISNGVASYAMNYFRHIDHDKIHMDFVALEHRESPYVNEILSHGSQVFFLPPIKQIGKHWQTCEEILKKGKYDIIHDNSLILTFPLMMCAKREKMVVRILHSHNSKLAETRFKEVRNRLLLPFLKMQANVFFACSELAGKCAFGKREFVLVPNAIDMNRYKPNGAVRLRVRKDMSVEQKFVVGSVGRLCPQKNPFFAVDVFEQLHRSLPNTEYWWIGTGIMDEKVKLYAEKRGILCNIRFLGNRTDVDELYQAMDVFFMPSLFEGLPVTAVEAQAIGIPCVLSDTITDELVYTDLVQYVSQEKEAKEWAKIIKSTLTDNRRISGNENREKFDIRCCALKLMDEYERAVIQRSEKYN